eukprot:s3079_g7.t1
MFDSPHIERDEAPHPQATSLVLKRLPPRCSTSVLLEVLDIIAARYDYVHLPLDHRTNKNMSMAFVNFVDHEDTSTDFVTTEMLEVAATFLQSQTSTVSPLGTLGAVSRGEARASTGSRSEMARQSMSLSEIAAELTGIPSYSRDGHVAQLDTGFLRPHLVRLYYRRAVVLKITPSLQLPSLCRLG